MPSMPSNSVPPPPHPGAQYPYYGGFGPVLVAVIWTLFALASVIMILRVIVRLTLVKNNGGWALIWALVAYALALPSNVLYDLSVHYGVGNQTDLVITDPQLPRALLFEWIPAVTISFSAWFGRVSALAFITAVQGRTHTVGKWILYFILAVLLIDYLVTVAMIFTQCTPAAKLWDSSLAGNCSGIDRAYYWAIWTGAWGTFADFVLALYPTFIIYRLQMSLKIKLILCSLMGVGVLAGIANLIKTTKFGALRNQNNPIYETAILMVWGAVEMWLIIIAGGVAPLWPLAQFLKSSFLGPSNDSNASLSSRRWFRHRGDADSNHYIGGSKASQTEETTTGISTDYERNHHMIEVSTEISQSREAKGTGVSSIPLSDLPYDSNPHDFERWRVHVDRPWRDE